MEAHRFLSHLSFVLFVCTSCESSRAAILSHFACVQYKVIKGEEGKKERQRDGRDGEQQREFVVITRTSLNFVLKCKFPSSLKSPNMS